MQAKNCASLRDEVAEFHKLLTEFHVKLSEFAEKIDGLENQVELVEHKVSSIDDDFRRHEETEKTLFDELLVAVLSNSKNAEEIRTNVIEVKDSVKVYVELQEDLTVMVRFIKKVGKIGSFLGKFAALFGAGWVGFTYAYEWFSKHFGG